MTRRLTIVTRSYIVVFRMCGEVVSRMCEVVSLNCTRVRVSKMSLRATDACETQVCSSHARVSLVTRARVCQATSGWYCMRDLYKRSRSHRVRSHSIPGTYSVGKYVLIQVVKNLAVIVRALQTDLHLI